jgi:hypothetical protein
MNIISPVADDIHLFVHNPKDLSATKGVTHNISIEEKSDFSRWSEKRKPVRRLL